MKIAQSSLCHLDTIITENTTENTTEINEQAFEEQTLFHTPGENAMPSSEEIKNLMEKKEPGSLQTLWKKRMSMFHPGFVHELKAKEKAQLKLSGKTAATPVFEVVEYVFEHPSPSPRRGGA